MVRAVLSPRFCLALSARCTQHASLHPPPFPCTSPTTTTSLFLPDSTALCGLLLAVLSLSVDLTKPVGHLTPSLSPRSLLDHLHSAPGTPFASIARPPDRVPQSLRVSSTCFTLFDTQRRRDQHSGPEYRDSAPPDPFSTATTPNASPCCTPRYEPPSRSKNSPVLIFRPTLHLNASSLPLARDRVCCRHRVPYLGNCQAAS